MLALVDQKQESQDVVPEALVASHDILRNRERVAEFLLDVAGLFDGLAHLVQSAGLKSHSDGLVELLILVAPLKHLVDNALHLGINHNALLLLVHDGDSLLDVIVDALVYEGVNIL